MKSKHRIAFVVIIWLAVALVPHSASAITAEVAKKCQTLLAKAYPPRVPGNPAAGFKHGTSREASEYFRKCVENNGNVDESNKQQGGKGQAPQGTK
jgi:hypothetical protein